MKINIDTEIAKYALKNELHVEFFIWCYLRSLKNNGCHDIKVFDDKKFLKSCFERKLKTNLFFTVANNKVFLKSFKNLPCKQGNRNFICDLQELNKFPRKHSHTSDRIIKDWNSTTIKYLMICVVACQYKEDKPYALKLISKDTGCSITIIQRALKNLYVDRWSVTQIADTMRSYYQNRKQVNLSPNYYKFLLGKYFVKEFFFLRII
jgi:hypothetical protein